MQGSPALKEVGMTQEFHRAVFAIPAPHTLPKVAAIVTSETSLAAKVIDAIKVELLEFQSSPETAGDTNNVERDIRRYFLSAASIDTRQGVTRSLEKRERLPRL
jgi:hypothetical protein